MSNFLLRKLVQGLAMLLIVSGITFVLLSAAGGDAFSSLRDNPQISAETIEHLREVYGMDKPVAARYFNWLKNAVHGDLGESVHFRVPVTGLVLSRFLNTLLLGSVAFLIAVSIAMILSVLSVRFRSRPLSAAIELLILITASAPRIVLALIVLALSVRFSGFVSNSSNKSIAAILPAALVLAAPLISVFLAQAHEGLLQAMKEDFTQLARAKGLSERAVIMRHALPAALNPLLTIFGLSLGGLLGGSVIVESVLGWPGVGALTITAVQTRDITVVLGVVLVTSCAVWLANAVAEVLQMLNDKRLRSDVR